MIKKGYLAFIIMALAITGGCNNYLGNKDVGDYDNKNSTELLKFGDKVSYKKGDQEIGVNSDEITDQNPNFLRLNTGDNDNHVNNVGYKEHKAREVIGLNNQFNAGPIWRNGNNLYVTVYPTRTFTDKQERQARAQLEKELLAAIPTCDIYVTVKNR